MGLLASIAEHRGTWKGPYSLKDPALAELFGSGGRTLAGPVVSEVTAMTCAAFYDGVNQIASDVAKLPLHFLKRREGGGSDHATDSKLYWLLKHSPNPETRTMVFRQTVTAHALIYEKGGFAEIGRDLAGRPAALWIMHPRQVEPFYDYGKTFEGRKDPLRYRIDGERVLEARDVLHIHGLSDDGVSGYGMVRVAREALGLALASQQFAAAFFGNGTRFGGVLSTENQDLDETQKKEIREEIEKLHARADRAFRLLILGMGFKYTEAGTKPSDAQMKEIRDQQVTEVARFLNMPLHKLKLNTPGAVSYSSVEMADLDYYKGPILNWVTTWEQELDAKLVAPLERRSFYFKHNANAFLRGDIKSRYDALGIARDKGIINADEWRELEDMNPQEGGQGKLYLVQSAQVPLDKIGALTDSQIKKNSTPAAAPSGPAPSGSDDGDRSVLLERVRAAEAAATEAREAYQRERDLRVAAEATGTANASEIAALRESEQRAGALAAQMTTLADEMRRKADDAQRAREAADAARREAETALAAAETAVAEAQTTADRLTAERDRALEAVRTADARVSGAHADLEAAQALRQEAEARAAAATTDREQVQASLREAEQLTADAQTAVTTHEAARAGAAAHAEAMAMAATEAQAALEAARADLEAVRAQLATETEARAAAERRIVEQEQAMTGLASAVAEREGERDTERTRAAELEAASEAQRQQLAVEAEARAEAERQAAEALRAAEDATVRLEQTAADAAARFDTHAAELAEARTQAEASAALCETLRAQVATAEAAQASASGDQQATIEELRTALAALEQARATDAARVSELETALEAQRQQERDRLTAVVAAHRGLLVDAVGRMTRREVQQARSKQATPEKLRRWLRDYPELQEAICIEAVLPAVRVHLAWQQSAEDPVAVTTALVREHIAAFVAQLQRALDAEPAEFHAGLDRVLTRWESDRAAAVADAFLVEAVRYVRAQ